MHERRHEVARAVTARVLQRYGEAALVGSAREAADVERREKRDASPVSVMSQRA